MTDQLNEKDVIAHADVQRTPSVQSRAELAAQYTAFENSLTVGQTIRVYWRSNLWVAYGLAMVFGFGIDGIIAANLVAIPQFRADYGKELINGSGIYIIPAKWLSLFTGISQLCGIIGALGTGWLADRIGRKYTTLISCVISIGGVAAQYASNGSLGVLTVGKAINGIPIGMWLVLGPLYASEVATTKLRGILISMTNIVQLSGVLLFTGVTYALGPTLNSTAYRIPLACQWIIPGLVLITVPLWPESPVWLVRTGRRTAAIQSIQRLYGQDKGVINGEALLAQIEEKIEQEKSQDRGTYHECFSKPERHRTIMCMFVYACQYLSGVVLVLGYQSYLYELYGYSAHESFLLSLLNISLQWIANIGSWFLLFSLGSRPLIVWGQFLAAISLFIIGGGSTSPTHSARQLAVAFMFIWVSLPSPPFPPPKPTKPPPNLPPQKGHNLPIHSRRRRLGHSRRPPHPQTPRPHPSSIEHEPVLRAVARRFRLPLYLQPRRGQSSGEIGVCARGDDACRVWGDFLFFAGWGCGGGGGEEEGAERVRVKGGLVGG